MSILRMPFGRLRFKNLLFSLLAVLLVYPAVSDRSVAGRVFAVFFSWLILSAGYASAKGSPARRMTAIILGVPATAAIWFEQYSQSFGADLANYILVTGFFFFVAISLMIHIMRSEKITTDTLAGAASVYLLLGISWAFLYSFLEFLVPGSFNAPEGLIFAGKSNWSAFTYFSFTTLTTTGYGDITPVTLRGQSLAIVESVTGVLFTALLISRLVGMYIFHATKEGAGDKPVK